MADALAPEVLQEIRLLVSRTKGSGNGVNISEVIDLIRQRASDIVLPRGELEEIVLQTSIAMGAFVEFDAVPMRSVGDGAD